MVSSFSKNCKAAKLNRSEELVPNTLTSVIKIDFEKFKQFYKNDLSLTSVTKFYGEWMK